MRSATGPDMLMFLTTSYEKQTLKVFKAAFWEAMGWQKMGKSTLDLYKYVVDVLHPS